MIKSVVLDGLTLHSTTTEVPYSINKDGAKGLGELSNRISAYDRPGEDGGMVTAAFAGQRLVTLEGLVKGTDAASFTTNRRALQALSYIQRDSNGLPLPRRLTITTLDDEVVFVDAYVRKVMIGIEHNNFAPYMVELVCPDPQLFIDGLVSSGYVSRPALGGVVYPVTYPAIYEGSTGGYTTVTNDGNAGTWPVITLRGQMTNPSIRHAESGTVMQLNASLGASDYVIIDMKEKTIVLNGSSSYLYAKTDDSDWFSLVPGSNTVYFTTGVTSDVGTMEVELYSAVAGV